MFRDEDELKKRVIEWLSNMGFRVEKSISLGSMELDIVAVSNLRATRRGFIKDRKTYLYAIEAKIATSRRLMLDLVEQAVTRLLVADYVLIAVPSKAEVWINSREKRPIEPPHEVRKIASRTYSRKIGIVSVDPEEGVTIVRPPYKSGLTQYELKEKIIKKIIRTS